MMPCSYCCTTLNARPAAIRPSMTKTTMTAITAPTRITSLFLDPSVVTKGLHATRRHRTIRSRAEIASVERGKTGGIIGMTTRDTDWDGVRLHVVTGKGGTGKTTVAAAMALALATAGRKVLLIEVEGRQGIARLFDCPPLPYQERKVAIGLGIGNGEGGDLLALAVDPEGALLDYLAMFYNMRRAGSALTKLGVVDFATTIAPGLSDVLVTGKATEATRRRVRAGSK